MDNIALFFAIHGLSRRSDFWDQVMIFGADYLIYFSLLFAIALFLKRRSRERSTVFLFLIGLIIAETLIFIIHKLYPQPRPFLTYPINPLIDRLSTSAFPSGHTTVMSVLTFAHYFYRSKWAHLFLVLTLWVGFARVFVGVHYPMDILGGLATGFISVLLAWQLIFRLGSKKPA